MRLFLSIRLPDDALQFAVETQDVLKPLIARQGVRFTSPQKMHLTLLFLGDDADPEKAHAIAQNVIPGCGQQILTVQGLGAFPDAERPKTLWVGVEGPHLNRLAQIVREAFQKQSDNFVGHITIARISPGSKAVGKAIRPLQEKLIEAISWQVRKIELVASHADGEYQVLNSYLL